VNRFREFAALCGLNRETHRQQRRIGVMTKSTITRIWIVGFIVFAVGLIMGGINVGLMLAQGGHFVPAASGNGSDFIPNNDSTFWTPLILLIVGFSIAAVGGIVQLAAWIGSLVNTNQLEDKTWFIIMIVCGLAGLGFPLVGFGAMIAYLVAGPDGTRHGPPQATRPVDPPASSLDPSI
jgi:hypothetical protein